MVFLARTLEVYQGDLEERPLAEGVEEGAGAEKIELVHQSLQECSKSHRDHRLD